MTQLLQGSGAGTSIPYLFLPGNHEVRAHTATLDPGETYMLASSTQEHPMHVQKVSGTPQVGPFAAVCDCSHLYVGR